MNSRTFKETSGAVCESYSSIKSAVGKGVERCKEQVLQQKKLSQEAQNSMLEILVRTLTFYILSIILRNISLKLSTFLFAPNGFRS